MNSLTRFLRPPYDKRLAYGGIAAAALAATAWWVSRRAVRAEEEYPPTGKFISIDGVRLHYLDRGRGTPLVLLHGNAVRLEDFVASGIVDRLAERHRVVVFDRPGFGHSDRPRGRMWTAHKQAELLSHALARLGVASPVVVGHSWGTLVALELALREDIDVTKLVLVSGYYFPTARIDLLLASPPAIPVVGDVLRYTISALVARLTLRKTLRAMFAPEPLPAHYLSTLGREMLVRPSQIRASAEDAAYMLPAVASLRKRYADLDMPVVILAGDRDNVVDQKAQATRLSNAVRFADVTFVEGAGHMLHHGACEEIVAVAAA